jgi:hypothetical protein
MPIKYGDLTIIHKETENVFTTLRTWLGYEKYATKESKLIFLFDDGEVYDVEDKLKDFKYKFSPICFGFYYPIYFEKTECEKDEKETKTKHNYNRIYFFKKPLVENKKSRLDFKPLFSSYTKYDHALKEPSIYNCIYYCHKSVDKPNIFGIIRIKSSESMPRFQFAYDTEEFTKEEIIYLINYIFLHIF